MEPQKSNGPLIGAVIIVIILIVGGIYLWQKATKEKPMPPTDDFAELEANLNEVDLESLDEEI